MPLVYHDHVTAPPGRQFLRFQAGGVALAQALSTIREIVPMGGGPTGEPPPGAIPLAQALGLDGRPRFALVPDDRASPVVLVDRVDGVADLAQAEAFLLPARTVAMRPSPFASVLRVGGALHLELSPACLPSMRPLPARSCPAWDEQSPAERELVAVRGGTRLGVPLPLVVQVVDPAPLFHVPLAPRGHRGILHHGRAIHPAWDAAALLGEPDVGDPRVLLLLDAGGTTAGVLVDRVEGFSAGGDGRGARRPPWDLLLSPGEDG